jgi:predicted unusual protein kinase regulating ubiquinone biosynthesis (AarF/ABC1/UbiB family)
MARRRTLLAALLAAVGAAGGGYLAVKRAGEQRKEEMHAVHTRSRAARTAAMAKMGTRAGSSYAVHRARRAFADADHRETLDAAFELKTAEQVAAALGNMKGALMKLGQMASYLDQGLPDHVREALAELQTDAPPMAPELSAQVIAQELGQPPDQLFEEWDPVPIASA